MTSNGIAVDSYVCSLDAKTLKKAKDELNEDEKNRMGSVETFRKWILQQSHIKCPTDTAFLLLFLRVRYFTQLEARTLLVKYLSGRKKRVRWFRDLDTADPKIQEALSQGLILLPQERDDEGRKIVITRSGAMAKYVKGSYTIEDLFRFLTCVFDYIYLLDEITCVNGTVFLMDISGYTMKFHSNFTFDEMKDFMQIWQGAYPARIKQVHLYNAGAMLDLLWGVFKLGMDEKMQKRVKNQGQVLEGVYKDIPMRCLPVEYLPDDYKGPNAGTIQQIVENMKNDMTRPEVRERIKYLNSSQFGINDSLKPKDDIPQASFRKLNID